MNTHFQNKITQAITILNQGGIIIFPTDTAFGIGCRLDKIDSITKLYKIRKRSLAKAVPVLCSGLRMVRNYLSSPLSDIVRQLMQSYWPGALTIIHKAKKSMSPLLVRGGSENIGVRIPNHEVPLSIIREIKVPILGSSANYADFPTPFNISDLDKDLIRQVDFVIDGVCKFKKVSTVINCTSIPFHINRQGAIHIGNKFLI